MAYLLGHYLFSCLHEQGRLGDIARKFPHLY
jgi:hypothetical protein